MLKEDYEPLGQDLEAFLRDWMQESSQRQIAVFGEYGQGKSTGSWLFAYHLIQNYDKHFLVPTRRDCERIRGRICRERSWASEAPKPASR
uniref:hypothetical protein n=1 Tax=Candidatus Thiosymbion oneisti TaxID=589554 RepID=UPI001C4030C3